MAVTPQLRKELNMWTSCIQYAEPWDREPLPVRGSNLHGFTVWEELVDGHLDEAKLG
jgi:hypothetical protein